MKRLILIQFGSMVMLILESSTTNNVSANVVDHQPNVTSADQQKRIVPTSSPNSLQELSNKIENSRQPIRSRQHTTSPAAPTTTQRTAIPTKRLPKLLNTSADDTEALQHFIVNGTETGLTERSFSYGGNYGGGGYSNAGPSSAGSAYMYGGGGSPAGGGNLMYFSNFDTALTTLAFLSFGVFLLNMIFSFLNMNNGTGSVVLGVPGGGRTGNETLREKRELLSAPILLALNTIQYAGFSARKFNNGKNDESKKTRNCNFFTFCSIQKDPFYEQQLREILTDLIKRSDNFKRDKALNKISHQQIGKFYQAKRLLGSGTCSKILDECANVLNPSARAPR